jgi:hypothetical protein
MLLRVCESLSSVPFVLNNQSTRVVKCIRSVLPDAYATPSQGCLFSPLPFLGLLGRSAPWPSWLHQNAKNAKGNGSLISQSGLMALDGRIGKQHGRGVRWCPVAYGRLGSLPSGICRLRPCCYACCYSRGSRPVAAVSRPVYAVITPPEIQETRKARRERALWRVLTRPDLSSQIEAPVGVGPTLADLQSAALATWRRRLIDASPYLTVTSDWLLMRASTTMADV